MARSPLFLLLLLLAAAPSSSFPIGTTYATTLHVPLLGSQHVRLTVEEANRATLLFSGLVALTASASFRLEEDDSVSMSPDPALSSFLSKYRVAIRSAAYDRARDEGKVTLRLRLLGIQPTLTLSRVVTTPPP